MKGPVSESKMGGILVHANLAANNVRAHRDRLLHLHLQLLHPPPSTAPAGAAALLLKKVASGLVDVSFGTQAFAHVEAAYYAVKSNQEHFIPRCVQRLGYPYHAYAAATENLAEIGLSDPGAGSTEPTEGSSKTGLPVAAASATGETPQAASVDLDQARTYLDRACTLANLAVKHIDHAVATVSSFTDPNDVADISHFVARLGN